jgi:PhnB protein
VGFEPAASVLQQPCSWSQRRSELWLFIPVVTARVQPEPRFSMPCGPSTDQPRDGIVSFGSTLGHGPIACAQRGHGIRLEGSAVMETFPTTITPVLTIRQAAQALAFYQQAFGAEEIYRNTYPDGRIVAELAIDGARFRVADDAPEASNLSPQALNGTSVRINLLVADPDQFCERAIAIGAVEIAPIADQSYGLRQGRLADPFGHHWLIGRPLAGATGDWVRTPER